MTGLERQMLLAYSVGIVLPVVALAAFIFVFTHGK